MKKVLCIAVPALISIVLFHSILHAQLIDKGGGLIYDTDLNITWMQNINPAGALTWEEAMAYVRDLVYQGYDDWRLPIFNVQGKNEFDHLFYTEHITPTSLGLFYNLPPWTLNADNPASPTLYINYWFGNEDPTSYFAYIFSGGSGFSRNRLVQPIRIYVWPVRDGDSQPLPACECDLNKDGRCNMSDWLVFGQDWGRADCLTPGVTCECDLNNDGRCNMRDWLLFGKNWGRTDCPAP